MATLSSVHSILDWKIPKTPYGDHFGMHIPVLILIALLGITPVLNHRLNALAYQIQRSQIALDNAAIALGREERATLNFLLAANRFLYRFERGHHAFHKCARAGVAQCLSPDRLMETAMSAYLQQALFRAQYLWRRALFESYYEGQKLSVEISSSSRPFTLPVTEKRCPICNRINGWEIDFEKYRGIYFLTPHQRKKALPFRGLISVVRVFQKEKSAPWNYQLENDEELSVPQSSADSPAQPSLPPTPRAPPFGWRTGGGNE